MLYCVNRQHARQMRCVGCKTGYDRQDSGSDEVPGDKPTLHSFPKDQILLAKWVKAISRKDFVPSQYSRVCSKHFWGVWWLCLQKNFQKSTLKSRIFLHFCKLKCIGAGAILQVEGHSPARSEFFYSAHPLLPCAHPDGWARVGTCLPVCNMNNG